MEDLIFALNVLLIAFFGFTLGRLDREVGELSSRISSSDKR